MIHSNSLGSVQLTDGTLWQLMVQYHLLQESAKTQNTHSIDSGKEEISSKSGIQH